MLPSVRVGPESHLGAEQSGAERSRAEQSGAALPLRSQQRGRSRRRQERGTHLSVEARRGQRHGGPPAPGASFSGPSGPSPSEQKGRSGAPAGAGAAARRGRLEKMEQWPAALPPKRAHWALRVPGELQGQRLHECGAPLSSRSKPPVGGRAP